MSGQTAPEVNGLQTGPKPEEVTKGFADRDQNIKTKERSGEIYYTTIRNDGTFEMMKDLIDLKNIFSKQLPKMPKDYICKLMFDRKHEAVVIKNPTGKILGGICFRVYEDQKFAEIAFLAITSEEQIKGYGTRLMNRLKKEMRERQIEFLMTYADNLAIQYFKKQGFSEMIQVPPEIWKGYLKDYDGSTHMECLIYPNIDYSEISTHILGQKKFIIDVVSRLVANDQVHNGLPTSFYAQPKRGGELDDDALLEKILQIPGVKESGFGKTEFETLKGRQKATSFKSSCRKVIEQLEKQRNIWPFTQPVKKDEVPDYFDVIKEPMDLQTVKLKIETNSYADKEEFERDVRLIFSNAKTYNQKNTIYYKYADENEAVANNLLATLKFDHDEREGMMEEKLPNSEGPVKKLKVRKATKKVEKQPPKEGVPKAGRAKLRRKFIKQTNQKKAGKGKGRK